MFLFNFRRSATHFEVGPSDEIEDTFWCRNDVKRWWDRSTILKIRDPQFAPGKFPLDIGLFLQRIRQKRKMKERKKKKYKNGDCFVRKVLRQSTIRFYTLCFLGLSFIFLFLSYPLQKKCRCRVEWISLFWGWWNGSDFLKHHSNVKKKSFFYPIWCKAV